MENGNIEINAYSDGSELYGTPLKPIPSPEKPIGVDLSGEFLDNLIGEGVSSQVDISKINSFTQISNDRERVMELIDTMAEDPTIAAALELYAEDATETNDDGQIVWVTSDDSNIAYYVSYLLDTMNVNKNIYKWVYSLCKYGDVYLRLFRESEYDDGLFDEKEKNKSLNEDVIVKAYSKNDNYSHYIEMVPNPAEMFELTRLGKSYAYIKANIVSRAKQNDMMTAGTYRYSFKKDDVEVSDATNFVHACLEDNFSRVPEEVEIFNTEKDFASNTGIRYNVRRGQSLLYNVFKIWREITLLENSLLLNRITKSSILRIIGVEVGDMPKENVGPRLAGIKQLIEQKSALDTNVSLSEYTSPGPIENNIYVPTRNGLGNITTTQVGGDVDVKGIADIDYFKNKFYSALRIPKQFLGDTDDTAGFSGGTSLALISSRYAKTVKRIQSTMLQALTDAVNLMLIDKNLDSYVNKFELRMQAPTTQEEKDRADKQSNQINMVQDIMNLIDGLQITSEASKLEIFKSLISSVISDSTIIKVLDEEIKQLIMDESADDDTSDTTDDTDISGNQDQDIDIDFNAPNSPDLSPESSFEEEPEILDTNLPTPAELGIGDLTDLNNEEI